MISNEATPLVLNANQLAKTLGISRAKAYQLLHRADFPTLVIDKRLLVPRDKLVEWVDRHTGGGEAANAGVLFYIERQSNFLISEVSQSFLPWPV